MTEPILSPLYWKNRLEHQGAVERHKAIFITSKMNWDAIAEKHRTILAQHIYPEHSVLDAGCAWGRLLGLMPIDWRGFYLGVDLSPDFIELAKQEHPDRPFIVADLSDLALRDNQFDWVVLISIRPMVKRNLGDEAWKQMEKELRRVSRRLLFLEYDVNDNGATE
jgi:ubiquinone/menaquinone biosynthesis C-methylase UbiE